MALAHLEFDPTDSNTRADTHTVGAVLYDKTNDRLGEINASNELKVKDTDVATALAGTITVDSTDLDIRDLTHVSDSTRLGDGTNLVTVTNVGADYGLDVNLINASIAVTASQLDIDDLNATDDAVAAWLNDGSGNAIGSTAGALDVNIASGSIDFTYDYAEDSAHSSGHTGAYVMSVRVDSLAAVPAGALAGTELDYQSFITGPNGELFIGANQLDIDDLNATDDAVQAWAHDGSGNAIGSTAGSLDVNVTNSIDVDDGIADTAIKAKAETVTNVAGQIVDGADELANRKYLHVFNKSNRLVYIGAAGVDTTDGFPVPPGNILETRIGPSVDVYMIGHVAGGQNVRTLQLS